MPPCCLAEEREPGQRTGMKSTEDLAVCTLPAEKLAEDAMEGAADVPVPAPVLVQEAEGQDAPEKTFIWGRDIRINKKEGYSILEGI